MGVERQCQQYLILFPLKTWLSFAGWFAAVRGAKRQTGKTSGESFAQSGTAKFAKAPRFWPGDA
jgi:hypothetical protein